MTTHNNPLSDAERIAVESLIETDLDTERYLQNQLTLIRAKVKGAQLAARSSRKCSKTTTSALKASRITITSLNGLKSATKRAVDTHTDSEKSTEEVKAIWQRILSLADALLQELKAFASKSPIHTARLLENAAIQDSIKAAAGKSHAAIDQSLVSVRNSISEKKVLLHPLRRVPTEILEIVFQYVVNADRERIRNDFSWTLVQNFGDRLPPKVLFHSAPFTIAAVCRRWRSIATVLPCLWTFLLLPPVSPNLEYNQPLGSTTSVAADRFDHSLALAKGEELELTIYGDPFPMSSSFLSKVVRRSKVAQLNIIGAEAIGAGLPNAKVVQIYSPRSEYVLSGQSAPLPEIDVSTGTFLGATEIVFHYSAPTRLSVTTLHTLHLHVTEEADIDTDCLHSTLLSLPNLRHFLLTSPRDTSLQPLYFEEPSVRVGEMRHLATLTVTSNFLFEVCHELLSQSSLPSLTTLILPDIFTRSWLAEVNNFQCILSNVTHLAIHRVWPNGVRDWPYPPPKTQVTWIRDLLEAVPNLLCLTLVGIALKPGIKALSNPPRVITLGQLVVQASDTEGTAVHNYVRAVNQIGGQVAVSFVNCPRILPHIRSQLL